MNDIVQGTDQQILDEAEKLFLEKGFALTSTTEIARRVGCNQALVHYYFRSKEKLFQLVFGRKMETVVSNMLQLGNENLTFEERVRARINTHFDMLKNNPKMVNLITNELTTNPGRIKSIIQLLEVQPINMMHQWEKELNEEYSKGTIRKVEPMDLMLTIFSLNAGVFLLLPIAKGSGKWSDEELEQLIERRKEEIFNIVIRSLRK